MTKKLKLWIKLGLLFLLAFMGNLWYQDYQNTHKTIEIEIPEVGDEVRG